MYCPNCKNEIPDGVEFCTFCDFPFVETQENTEIADIEKTFVYDKAPIPSTISSNIAQHIIEDTEPELSEGIKTLNVDDRLCGIGHSKLFLTLGIIYSIMTVLTFFTNMLSGIVSVAICAGLWLCYTATATTTEAPSKIGVSIIRTVKIISLCIYTFALIAYCGLLGMLIVFGNDFGFSGTNLIVFWILCLIFLIATVFSLSVDVVFLGGVKHTVEYGAPSYGGSLLYAVLRIISALISVISMLLLMALSTEINDYMTSVLHDLRLGLDLLSFLPEKSEISLSVFSVLASLLSIASNIIIAMLTVSYRETMIEQAEYDYTTLPEENLT